MPNALGKLDRGLSTIYAAFLQGREGGEPGATRAHKLAAAGMPLQVRVQYRGSLASAEALGLRTIWNDGNGTATGGLRLEDVERVAACPEILRISYGEEFEVALDKSVPDVRATMVWNRAGSVFSPGNGGTGKGALVGIIDTGIDFRNPFFMADATLRKTRIVRIWDQGLTRTGAEKSPDKALLDPGTPGTYGVEYDAKSIDDVLSRVPGASIRHRDCSAHGTHVASIAAGDGRPDFKFVGVAPEAGIVVVKAIFLDNEPIVDNAFVGGQQRFFDAIAYMRNVADALGKPIAINLSAGSPLGAHDGVGELEDFLDTLFDDSRSAGKVFVTTAGNVANARRHARVEFPSGGGIIEIPFELFDRRTNWDEYDRCFPENGTKTLFIDCYYAAGGPTLIAEFKPTGAADFSPPVALDATVPAVAFERREFRILHRADTFTRPGSGSTTERNNLTVAVSPHALRGHLPGTYRLRLTSTAKLTAHIWTTVDGKPETGHGIVFGDPVPPGVFVEDRFLLNSPCGAQNVIAVAAYDAEKVGKPIAPFSSRGPLIRWSGPGTPPPKPDLAAPGVSIDAAKSRDIMPMHLGATISFQGTSMAAPHVTGAAALVLEKRPSLTPSQVLSALRLGIDSVPAADAEKFGAGRLDVNGAVISFNP